MEYCIQNIYTFIHLICALINIGAIKKTQIQRRQIKLLNLIMDKYL